METLESRRLLAGDVSVEVVDGDLVIRGDRDSNAIEIYGVGDTSSTLVIRGLESSDGTQTTVNGADQITVEGVTGDLNAAMYRGDDVVYLHDADLSGNINIRTGKGNDTVLVGGLPRDGEPNTLPPRVIDTLLRARDVDAIDVSRSENSIDSAEPIPVDPVPLPQIANVNVRGSVSVSTASGEDQIGMGSVVIGGDLNLRTGRHDDTVRLGINELPEPPQEPAPVENEAVAPISLPLNVHGTINMNTGGGADFVWLESIHAGEDLRVRLGSGDDLLGFDWGRVDGRVGILGSSGEDLIGLAHLAADQIAIRTGRGDDGVGLAKVRANRIGVGLGGGNDRMLVANSAAQVARFHGGSGTDSLELQGENQLHDLAILSFESIS